MGTSLSTLFLSWDLNKQSPTGNSLYDAVFVDHETAKHLLSIIEPIQLGYGAVLISFLGAIHWVSSFHPSQIWYMNSLIDSYDYRAWNMLRGSPSSSALASAMALVWPPRLWPGQHSSCQSSTPSRPNSWPLSPCTLSIPKPPRAAGLLTGTAPTASS